MPVYRPTLRHLAALALIAACAACSEQLTPPAPIDSSDSLNLTPTSSANAWQQVMQAEIITQKTAEPTATYTPAPTETPTPLKTIVWQQTPTATRFVPDQPTAPAPVAFGAPTEQAVARNNDPRKGQFSPPPEQVPLSLDPRDHFWFRRPVDTSANSASIFWYAYGADGPQNLWRVHHGLDLPNPIGKEVFAAAPGTVIWADDNYIWYENGQRVESAYTYGNVVIIEHDFGFQGKRLYTLYAHLQVILTKVGQRVQTGEIIGLSGRSGVVSGPHVHFEVRVGRNNYYETRNPLLWMAPYENHGVVAGRVLFENGLPVEDVTVQLIRNGRVVDTTTTYVNPRRPGRERWNVNPDEVWRENFVIGDVPAGEYQVAVTVNGQRFIKRVTVRSATTSFIDLTSPDDRLLPTPTPAG
ncbi:MAG: hypothetical protein OHK0023_18480 [Anaerolineae bacterium]